MVNDVVSNLFFTRPSMTGIPPVFVLMCMWSLWGWRRMLSLSNLYGLIVWKLHHMHNLGVDFDTLQWCPKICFDQEGVLGIAVCRLVGCFFLAGANSFLVVVSTNFKGFLGIKIVWDRRKSVVVIDKQDSMGYAYCLHALYPPQRYVAGKWLIFFTWLKRYYHPFGSYSEN